jgi:hypothetical protein
MAIAICRPRPLTPAQASLAARRSIEINPANAFDEALVAPGARRGLPGAGGGRRLAVVIARRWPAGGVRLSVQFMDNPSPALRARILRHMNAWGQQADVKFSETRGQGQVRITRASEPPDAAGHWSYIGTEILGIEPDQPTMNLDGFTMRTPESEFVRVVRHETGHTLGFDHEHMRSDLIKRIDRKKAIAYFRKDQGWTAKETTEQVLTPLRKASLMGTTEADPVSIMCYELPGDITKDGLPIIGGVDINPRDHAFAARIYPKPQRGEGAQAGDMVAEAAADASASPPAQDDGAAPADHAELLPGPWGDVVEPEPAPAPPAPVAAAAPDDAAPADALHLVVMDAFDGEAARAPGQPRFARLFASYGGARVTAALRLRKDDGGTPTRWPKIIALHERIKDYTNREAGSLPDDAAMVQFGADLFETLFQGDVRRLYDEARARQGRRRLDLVLTSMIPWIAEKPWEFAYDATRCSFLATEDIHFVRNVLTAIPADALPPRRGALRILVVSAQPVGYGQLSIEQETAVIRRGFDALAEAGLAEVQVLPRATPAGIHAALATGSIDIVHVIAHGSFDEATQEGALMFEDGRGGTYPLGARSVREIFCQRGVRLVFLNACQSGSGGKAEFNKGLAQALVSHGLPALVANQYSVLDNSATTFAQQFYWALAQGFGIGAAAREARIAVNYSMHGEPIDWAVPVVYARDPALTLAVPVATRGAAPGPRRAMPAARGASARSAQAHAQRIAVWDIDNVFPALDATLERMNAVQSGFGFELVDLSAPMDAWDVDHTAPDGTPYLRADRLAERLMRATVDLRVTLLACITRHWMSDGHTHNLYGWVPLSGQPPVVVLSVAGFDGLAPEGAQTDRTLANAAVAALAGFLGRRAPHGDDGQGRCPLSFNAARSLAHVSGRQAFDRECRAALKKSIPDALPALEALLKAFA